MRSKFLIIASLILAMAAGLSAQVTQEWVSRYNDSYNSSDYGRAVAVDGSGNVYVTGYGYYSSTSYPDIITVKYNSAGVQQWAVNYNAPYGTYEYAYAIAVDASGNVYVGGYGYVSSSNYDMITLKYNTAGALQWARTYNGSGNSSDYVYDIAVDASGNVYTAGYVYSSTSGSYNDMCVLKYNSSGTLQWAGIYNSPVSNYQYGRAVAVDGSGNVYLAGYGYYTNTSYYDAIVVKYNSAGTQQWVGAYNSPINNSDYGYDVAVDGSGNVYLGGITYYSSSSNADFLVVKYNSSGAQQWMRNWNGPQNSYDYGYYLKCTTAGDVYVAGYGYYSSASSYDLELVKYNTSGTFQWAVNYNGPSSSYDYMSTPGNMLALDAAGNNAYICGYGYGTSGNYDYETVKFNSAGAFQWAMTYNGPGNSYDYCYGVAVDASNNVYVTGYSTGSGTGYDYATIKYSQTPPVTGMQPDNQIKNSSESVYIGDNIYNTDGTNQTKAQTVDAGTTAVYHILIQNDGTSTGTFSVNGTGSGSTTHATWTVAYYDALSGGSDITSQVTGSGWPTGSIAAGAWREIRAEVTSDDEAWGLESYSVLVTTTSTGDTTKKDAVRATTTVTPRYQPDNLIKRSEETTYIGDNIYNTDGTNQTKSYITNYWTPRTFHVRIENDDNLPDSFNVTGIVSGTDWTVKFYDALTGGSDITSQVTGAGWPAGFMNPRDFREIRIEVVGGPTSDTLCEILLTSTSTASTSNTKERDAVKAVIIAAGAQPDAQIKNASDTLYAGDDVYNKTGMNQTKEQTTGKDSPTAVFDIKIQNDYEDPENNPDVIQVNGDNGNDSWTVRYYDALTGGNDITNVVVGTGWETPALKTREYEIIRLEIMPADTSEDSITYSVLITATSINDANREDAVKAVVTYVNKPGSVNENDLPENFTFDVAANKVSFTLPKATNISLCVYDVTGRVVAALASGKKDPGSYTIRWDAPTGVYFVKMVTPEFSAVRKVAIIH